VTLSSCVAADAADAQPIQARSKLKTRPCFLNAVLFLGASSINHPYKKNHFRQSFERSSCESGSMAQSTVRATHKMAGHYVEIKGRTFNSTLSALFRLDRSAVLNSIQKQK
jgi:hypothetical protein